MISGAGALVARRPAMAFSLVTTSIASLLASKQVRSLGNQAFMPKTIALSSRLDKVLSPDSSYASESTESDNSSANTAEPAN